MPAAPDCASIVINGKSGYVRNNNSWILGRILRDYDFWMPQQGRDILEISIAKNVPSKQVSGGKPPRAALFVSVFRARKDKTAGVPGHDLVWASGIVVAFFQLGIASIPFGIFGDWSVFLITCVGILLSFATGALPQWKDEKWNCRDRTDQNYILTRGNGAQHAIVILGDGHGLNLEDLAAGEPYSNLTKSLLTRVSLFVLAILWIALLITSAALENNTWFLLAVGGLGILHNSFVAGWRRKPDSFGIHLEPVEFLVGPKVMGVLMNTEKNHPHIGRSMLPIFFPGKLWENEEREWALLDLETIAYDAEQKLARVEKDLAGKEEKQKQLKEVDNRLDKEIQELERKVKTARQAAFTARKTAQQARQSDQNLKQAAHSSTI